VFTQFCPVPLNKLDNPVLLQLFSFLDKVGTFILPSFGDNYRLTPLLSTVRPTVEISFYTAAVTNSII